MSISKKKERHEGLELVFALVGPSGCDLDSVVDSLQAELRAAEYCVPQPIRLASLLHGLISFEGLADVTDEVDKIEKHMNAGDELRKKLENGGALAALAVSEIRDVRKSNYPTRRIAHILRSLKHPGEIALLREVYGSALQVVSVYESRKSRIRRLSQRFQKKGRGADESAAAAEKLIKRDAEGLERISIEDDSVEFGQSVQKAFPLADFFVKTGVTSREDIRRFIHILLSNPFLTPTRDEHAMFMAQASALRSSDLSRQVGAVVVNEHSDLLASGCNEVPKYGGGTYWDGDDPDGRDFVLGEDPNAIMRGEILTEVFTTLKALEWLGDAAGKFTARELAFNKSAIKAFKGTRVSSLVEFGRVIHAEMNALTSASRSGVPLAGMKLYCTTFPCHGCARHILSSGIVEVVFIEPYPKSLAAELYPESISIEGEQCKRERLIFRPFLGIAPRRYMEFFEFVKRKDSSGYVVKWDVKSARPRGARFGNSHTGAEEGLLVDLGEALMAFGEINDIKNSES